MWVGVQQIQISLSLGTIPFGQFGEAELLQLWTLVDVGQNQRRHDVFLAQILSERRDANFFQLVDAVLFGDGEKIGSLRFHIRGRLSAVDELERVREGSDICIFNLDLFRLRFPHAGSKEPLKIGDASAENPFVGRKGVIADVEDHVSRILTPELCCQVL